MRRLWHVLTVLVITALTPATAAELRLGLTVEPDSIDPHVHNFGGNKSFMPNVFEALTTTDAHDHLVANLAASWRMIDDTTWEFRLRPDVRFSDGSALTADDVAFTIARVPVVPTTVTSFAEYVKPIDGTEVIDPLTIRLHTAVPFPLAPEYLSTIGIVSRRHGETAQPSDYNTGKAAVGTGPFRFVSWARGDRLVMSRNDLWWRGAVAWDRVTIRYVKNPASRLATLLAGDVDLIDQLSVQDLARVRGDTRFTVVSGVANDIVGFVFDLQDRSSPKIADNDGRPLPVNPFRDQRVRTAVNLAIDRDAIRDRIMNGQSLPHNQFMLPGQYGYDPDLPPLRFNPAEAKRKLADSGYTDGFRLTMDCQNDRFVNDAAICQAVAQMLTRVGIATTPEVMPHAVWVPKANRHEFSFFTTFWTIDTPEPSVMLISQLATPDAARGRGAFNRSTYSNAAFDATLDQALTTTDAKAREKLLVRAIDIAGRDQAQVPLHRQFNIEAMDRRFKHLPRNDGHMLAADIQPEHKGDK